MTTRRDFVGAATASTLLVGPVLAASSGATATRGALATPSLPDISFKQREPFLGRERAQAVVAAEGLDAMVVGRGSNTCLV